MLEKDFHQELVRGLEIDTHWAWKVPDLARGIVKPCDIVACTGYGYHWAIECKLVKFPDGKTGDCDIPRIRTLLRESDFRSHQLPHLRNIHESYNGQGLIGLRLHSQDPLTSRSTLKRAWLFPVRLFDATDRKVTLHDLNEVLNLYELRWQPGSPGCWRLPDLFMARG